MQGALDAADWIGARSSDPDCSLFLKVAIFTIIGMKQMLRRNDTKGKIFCLIPALLMASAGYSQTAKEYFYKGLDRSSLQDYKGAIADYSIIPFHLNLLI